MIKSAVKYILLERLLNGTTADEAESEEQHEHCATCVRTDCKNCSGPSAPGNCSVVHCELHCGAQFHACKAAEHRILCPLELVPCINSNHGCPRVLTRQELGTHLGVCPASVVQCTMEWNRWPVFSQERQSRVPFAQNNMHARYGQLDVALALRDQRMLNAAMLVPRNTRRALRNPLTLRFPAVPLNNSKSSESGGALNQSGDTSQMMSDDDSDAPWMRASNPPGLQRSVCNELFRATKRATESLSAALSVVTDAPNGESPQTDTTHNVDLKEKRKMMEKEEVEERDSPDTRVQSDQFPQNMANISSRLHMNIDPSGEYAYSIDLGNINMATAREKLSIQLSPKHPVNPLWQYSDVNIDSESVDTISDSTNNIPTPPVPCPTFKLNGLLGLDLNLESITRYQAKPKSMYTFLCAQNFRRDEYTWHFKNVHSDIHGGLNGWLEQRCPLAHYGCTFSVRRLYPSCVGSKVVYSQLLESFGITPHVPELLQSNCTEFMCAECDHSGSKVVCASSKNQIDMTKEATPEIFTSKDYDSLVYINGGFPSQEVNGHVPSIPENSELNTDIGTSVPMTASSDSSPGFVPSDSLSHLPFEILCYIARFLDGFSLCNLALTSRRLREVCRSMLEEKGMVIEEWERHRHGDRWTWHVAYRRWMFSTGFSPIHSWGHEDHGRMSEHLKTCPYFSRSEPKTPLKPLNLPSMECRYHHSPQFWKTMHRMYPDFSPDPPVKVNRMKKSCSTDGCLASALDEPCGHANPDEGSEENNMEVEAQEEPTSQANPPDLTVTLSQQSPLEHVE